ncbi:MAG: glycine cleavage system aminomethyltransferase GcvT [Bacteroidales bacterium]|jgi:aminomethyltransferase|nr:glycine cleavage system aminomethyltransferase GcvT [Bacteroidales bacterium]MDI9591447.1 glycine cleavage system aminomethyltransferase GcvT [Bacteroidota bacterium]NLH33402.1 glycine cleavage system aminomethyltransferase GcvT [Lentimicrobium sp.]OQC38709.1 MAG: Aminomethyltransferase [Bacteroidetes bacterium ADurb.Bin041]MBP7874128.1 glycine cleavage system aminomethyltransferase GcvT [Bacteroidales bacterium]
MKNTAFIRMHEALGAKIVPFAGFNMPIQFEGVNAEHETVRKAVGVFDVSHMGEIWVRGPKAVELLQKLLTNDVSKLVDGKIQYTCFTNHLGGIVDDLLLYRFDAENYLLAINASNIEKDWKWMQENNDVGAIIENASDTTSQLAIQGPKAMATLQKLTNVDLTTIPYYTFKVIEFAGLKDVIMSATGYTGEKNSYEIYFPNEYAGKIWNAVFEAGAEFGIKPIGLGARDTLRLEMGFCLYGNDINETTSPIEAGLGWITKFVEGKDFINRAYHENLKINGVTRRLRGFEMIDKGIPRQHYEICDADGNIIGKVTSGTMSPSLKKAIGMGYLKTGFDAFGQEIYIKIREKLLKAKVVKTPFYEG